MNVIHNKSFVVYQFTCGTCNSSYYGKAERHCHVRWCEHVKIIPKKKTKPTAVQQYINSSNHPASLENYKIIGNERTRSSFYLRVKESLLTIIIWFHAKRLF